jgi:hypothetical protein
MNKSLADNFNSGYKAFSHVDKRDTVKYGMRWHQVANPLKKGTTPYREWQRGWEAAYFKNLEKQNGPRKRS